jgi:hypothetical protein
MDCWEKTVAAMERLMTFLEIVDRLGGGFKGELWTAYREAGKAVRELREHVDNSEECEKP